MERQKAQSIVSAAHHEILGLKNDLDTEGRKAQGIRHLSGMMSSTDLISLCLKGGHCFFRVVVATKSKPLVAAAGKQQPSR